MNKIKRPIFEKMYDYIPFEDDSEGMYREGYIDCLEYIEPYILQLEQSNNSHNKY